MELLKRDVSYFCDWPPSDYPSNLDAVECKDKDCHLWFLPSLPSYTELRFSKDGKNSDLSLRNQIRGILMAGLLAIITHVLCRATKDLCYVVLLKTILIDQQYFFCKFGMFFIQTCSTSDSTEKNLINIKTFKLRNPSIVCWHFCSNNCLDFWKCFFILFACFQVNTKSLRRMLSIHLHLWSGQVMTIRNTCQP